MSNERLFFTRVTGLTLTLAEHKAMKGECELLCAGKRQVRNEGSDPDSPDGYIHFAQFPERVLTRSFIVWMVRNSSRIT